MPLSLFLLCIYQSKVWNFLNAKGPTYNSNFPNENGYVGQGALGVSAMSCNSGAEVCPCRCHDSMHGSLDISSGNVMRNIYNGVDQFQM